jgi:hypothetical protein
VVPMAVQQPMYLHNSVNNRGHIDRAGARTHHCQRRKQLAGSRRLVKGSVDDKRTFDKIVDQLLLFGSQYVLMSRFWTNSPTCECQGSA